MKKLHLLSILFIFVFTFTFLFSNMNVFATTAPMLKLKIDKWGYSGNNIVKTRDGTYEDYNCSTGSTNMYGVDLTKLKSQCASVINSQGGQSLYAYAGFFDARYSRNQLYYGFYINNIWQNLEKGNLSESGWILYEPNFNSVFVTTGKYICSGTSCSNYVQDGTSWREENCSQTTIGTFTSSETRAICNRSLNLNQTFALKLITENRNVNNVVFVGSWDGAKWIDPISGSASNWKNI